MMQITSRRRYLLIVVSLCALLWLTTACGLENIAQINESQKFELDPVYRIFVRNLGGSEIVGSVLSPMMEYGEKKIPIFGERYAGL